MSHAATLPRPDTVSITVSGPSTALAYARALAAKARGWAGAVVTHVTMAIRTITRIPKAVANVALSALSTRIGYDTVTAVVGKAARFLGRLASSAIRFIGRCLHKAAKVVTQVVRHVAPKIAESADRATDAVASAADAVMTTIEATGVGMCQIVGALVRSPLVMVSTIRAAGIASAALAVHTLTKGAAATRIVRAIPSAMTLVVWATSPWKLLAAVAVITAAAMAFAAFRLGDSTAPTPIDPTPEWEVIEQDGSDRDPADATALDVDTDADSLDAAACSVAVSSAVTPPGLPPHSSPANELSRDEVRIASSEHTTNRTTDYVRSDSDDVDLVECSTSVEGMEPGMSVDEVATLASSLRVAIAVDGSIEVHGIPASLPEDEQRRIAQVAADAAAQQLRRIARRGRPLRSADRRHLTRSAQAAVVASGDRPASMAA